MPLISIDGQLQLETLSGIRSCPADDLVDRVVAKAVISRTSGVSGMTMPATLSAAVVDKCTPLRFIGLPAARFGRQSSRAVLPFLGKALGMRHVHAA
jgi:hypothetical protein